MPSLQIFFSFLLFFLFLVFPQRARGDSADCSISSCPARDQPVRFPFRLRRIQKRRCGYPKFDLSCSNQTQLTTLTLPGSGAFLVNLIDYRSQTLWINDPNNCLPKRLLAHPFSLHDTPFSFLGDPKNYTFLNCSSSQTMPTSPAPTSISCLSSEEYRVYAVPSSAYYVSAPAPAPVTSSSSSPPELCSVISTALVPIVGTYEWETNMDGRVSRGAVALTWSQPDCSDCEARNKLCGLDRDTRQILCSDRKKSPGLPRGIKYSIILGVGIPGLLLLIGITHYIYSKFFFRLHPPGTDDASTSTALQSANVVVGLDAPTIESYPKTLLGESRRLPRANDNTCSICLGEYQPKEALRTIPECNHYFHANCIDEWLKLNATCPVCRKSPEGSSLITPSSSVSSSSSSSLASLQ